MSIRSILVPLDGTVACQPVLELASMLARDLSAHVDAVHVGADAKDAVPLLGEGMSAAIIEEMIQLAEKEAAERAARAGKMFEEVRARYALDLADTPSADGAGSAQLVRLVGREDEVTAVRGRLCDLIVTARAFGDGEASNTMTINAALFETGRPVLIAPPAVPTSIGRKIAVSWNGSAEASRAVSSAMPLLARAEGVVILAAEAGKASLEPAGELARYFAWHGVSAEIRALDASGAQVGEALLGECAAIGADLLVMGAYTHSRMRQLILGGVTRHVLANATLPVLMAH
jgi:nucleotide-binding universal stress UspA family protein